MGGCEVHVELPGEIGRRRLTWEHLKGSSGRGAVSPSMPASPAPAFRSCSPLELLEDKVGFHLSSSPPLFFFFFF